MCAAMISKAEYLQCADECFRWAREAKSDAERAACLDLARTWTKAALCQKDDILAAELPLILEK